MFMPMIDNRHTRHNRQSGVALVTALMIMLILTILGVTVMNMTSLEEKMAFNTQDRYRARYLTESLILQAAVPANLPNPAQPGADFTPLALNQILDSDQIEAAGLQAGNARITYVQDTPFANLPKSNAVAQYLSSGSGDSDPVVFQIYATATTRAGTNAQMKAGYYFVRHGQN